MMTIQMSNRNRRGTLQIGSNIWQFGPQKITEQHHVKSETERK